MRSRDRRWSVKGERTLPLKVSGVTFVPAFSHSEYDDGAWVTATHLAALPQRLLQVPRLRRQVPAWNGRAVGDHHHRRGHRAQHRPPLPPADVVNLRTVRSLPSLMGLFLALLAIGAVGHALVTAVHRRGHDMAVLRVLGLTGPQVRATVAWQATALAVVGLCSGYLWDWRWAAPCGAWWPSAPPCSTSPRSLCSPWSWWCRCRCCRQCPRGVPRTPAARQRISTVLRAE